MNRLMRHVLRWLQRRCDHAEMKADLLEGGSKYRVAWCETCGAVCVSSDVFTGTVRTPEPTWHPFPKPRSTVFEPTPTDAEVKARLAEAGIDMRPAYVRMHKMVADAKSRLVK